MRLRGLSRFQYLFQSRALVLMYHRVNSPIADPWNLSVGPSNFEDHLKVLKSQYNIVSTAEIVQQIKSGKVKNGSVAITFDDGYLDNHLTAKPLLEKYSVPATFFITDSYLGCEQPFWWDELELIILHTAKLPKIFNIQYNGNTIFFDLSDESVLNDKIRYLNSNYYAISPKTLRSKLYLMLWKIFSPLERADQIELMQIIRHWANLTEEETWVEGAMSAHQLKQISENPLFSIGGHTKTHPSLPELSDELQYYEISENLQFLNKLINKEINLFAYPSGRYNDVTIRLIKNLNLTAAFSTRQMYVKNKTSLFEICRYQVNNWDKDIFDLKLKKWFT